MIDETDVDEEDMTMAGRHAEIMEDGVKSARMLGYVLILMIGTLICACLYFFEKAVEASR